MPGGELRSKLVERGGEADVFLAQNRWCLLGLDGVDGRRRRGALAGDVSRVLEQGRVGGVGAVGFAARKEGHGGREHRETAASEQEEKRRC